MSLVSISGVDFRYTRDRPTLEKLQLKFRDGAWWGVVGEPGSVKTRLLGVLLVRPRPSAGRISFEGRPVEPRNGAFMRDYRRKVQAVFQDPYSSLDPRQTVLGIVSEPLRSLRLPGDHRAQVEAALAAVDLEPDVLGRYPHQFSGGQRQRIAIARAMVARPRLLLADEAVSALDLSTRVRIVELLQRVAAHMTLVFVSHDLGVVAALCDEIVILQHGRIVEAGPTRGILADPRHPYTRNLLQSVPRMPA